MAGDKSKEIRVGALIALGFVIIFGAFFMIGNQQGLFTRRYEINTKFGNVEGLTVGASVRLGGVKVGTVKEIEFSPWGHDKAIIVTMAVSSSSFARIKADSRAKLGSQGLLGDRTIDITLGTLSAPTLRQGEFINSIETSQINDIISESGDVLTDVKVTAQNAKEISWKINNGDGSLAKIINDPRLYTNLDSLLIIWSDISEKLNNGQGSLALLVNDSGLYNNLTSSLKELSVFMANINKGEGSLGKLAKHDAIYNHLDSILTSINNTLTMVNGGNGTVGQLASNPNLYEKVNTTLDALNALIVDIKQNPHKYVKISLF
jgi:phospholipid/cholesterol/gamma-HCH transport system substrate-binding protein